MQTFQIAHGETQWLQVGKVVQQGYILFSYVFNLLAEYILREARLEEDENGFKTGRTNIINLCYADNTTLIAKNKTQGAQ